MTAIEQLSRTVLLCRDYVDARLSDHEICGRLQSVRVLCVSDRDNLLSLGGQTALVTLVSLLSRMGMQVDLDVPDVPLLAPQPPLLGSSLHAGLLGVSENLISGALVRENSGLDPDLVFVLGNTNLNIVRASSWRLSGSEWYGALANVSANTNSWTARLPVGSMVSAALAANEAFKYAMRGLPLTKQADGLFFEMSPSCSWDFGSVSVPTADVDLGEVDVVSAGAISQAALYALSRIPRIHMRGRIFDHDVTDASNLNRNMLTLVTDVGESKVSVAGQRCGPAIQLKGVPTRFGPAGRAVVPLASRVLVGVDDIPSRWGVQRAASGWVGVGGTSHFSVSSSAHGPREPCCGCLHPVDDAAGANPIPTVSFVSFWAGLAMAVRLLREAVGDPYPLAQQHLWLTPLRMDQTHAAMWLPIAFRRDCPVCCLPRGLVESQPLKWGGFPASESASG